MFVYFVFFLLGYVAVFRLMSQTLTMKWGDISVVYYIRSIIWPQGRYINQALPKTDSFFMRSYIRQISEKIDASDADSDSIRLLLIGDHVDWNAVEDWCRLRNHTTVASLYTIQKFGWGTGDESLLYDKGRSPIYCFDPSTGDSIAALHIFSSGDSQTEDRITKGLKLYKQKFGRLDKVFLSTVSADHSYMVSGDLNMESFKSNVKKRVEQISKLAGPTIEVGLRTTIWKDKHEHGGGKEDYLSEMNKAVRDVSAQLNCSLYDLDQDAWSIFNFNHNSESAHDKLFRETGSIDPVPKISQAAAEKMLGRQYSAYYSFRGLAGRQVPLDVTAKDVFGKVIVRIIRVAKEGGIAGEKGKSDEDTGSSVFVVPPPTAIETDDGPGSGQQGKKQDTAASSTAKETDEGPGAAVEVSSSKVQHARSKYLSAEEIRVDAEYDAQLASARAAIAEFMAKKVATRRRLAATDSGAAYDYFVLEYGANRKTQVRRWSVWAHRLESMMRCLHFGSGDVLTVTAEQAAAVPLAGGMPALFGDDDMGEPIAGLKAVVLISPESNRLCIMFGGSCDDVEVLDASAKDYQVDSLAFSKMPEKGHVDGVVARKVSDYWLRMILPPHPKKLPDIYFADSLLRFHLDKQVFHLDGYLKRAVTLNVMTAHGWDFENVHVLSDKKYMDILPTGPAQD